MTREERRRAVHVICLLFRMRVRGQQAEADHAVLVEEMRRIPPTEASYHEQRMFLRLFDRLGRIEERMNQSGIMA